MLFSLAVTHAKSSPRPLWKSPRPPLAKGGDRGGFVRRRRSCPAQGRGLVRAEWGLDVTSLADEEAVAWRAATWERSA